MSRLDPPSRACLQKTRSSVLNVLMVIAAGIAISGPLLRWRDQQAVWRASEGPRRLMLGALLALIVISHATRRFGGSRAVLQDAQGRARRFYWSHVGAAIIASLTIPLGLVFGWTVRPTIEAVLPFWIAGLALGFLCFPRSIELEDFETPMPDPAERKT